MSETVLLFYWLDIGVALLLAGSFLVLPRLGVISSRTARLYWAGVLVGLGWEIPFYLLGPDFSAAPLYELRLRYPLHPFGQFMLHAFWDGGLFLLGLALAGRLLRGPILERFRWDVFLVLVVFGQAQSIAIEVLAGSGGTWEYLPRVYNPVLARLGSVELTLLPQLVWVLGPAAYLRLAMAVARRPV